MDKIKKLLLEVRNGEFITPRIAIINKWIEDARIAENKEWREGRRCEICGEPKGSMCTDCFENE